MISKLKYTALSLLIIFAYSAAHAVINGVNVTVTASTLCNNGTIEKNFTGGCPGAWTAGALVVTPPTTPSNFPTCDDRSHTVSVSASGGGDGSVGNPWTLSEAMSNAVAGNTVCVLAGQYVGSDPSPGDTSAHRYTPAFRPANSGTEQNPIWFVAEYPASAYDTNLSVVLSGATTVASGWPAMGVLSRDHVKFNGFRFDETIANGKSGTDSAPFVAWTCTGCEIHNYEAVGVSHSGDNHSGIRIENTVDFVESNGYISGFSGHVNAAGIIVYYSRAFELGNGVIENVNHGVQLKSGESATINISDLSIHNKIIRNATHAFRFHGPVLGDSGELSLIHNNIAHDVSHIAEFTSSATHVGEQDGLRIFNNTFYNITSSDPAALIINHNWDQDGTNPRSNIFFNNIIHTAGRYWGSYLSGANSLSFVSGLMQSDRNVLHNISQMFGGTSTLNSSTLADYQALSRDVNSITLDPLFADAANDDYSLQAGSPALTLGRDTLGHFGTVDATIPAGAYVTGSELIGLDTTIPVSQSANYTIGSGSHYYVTKSGNDSNDCLSIANACLTINHALSLVSAGDTINVSEGVWSEDSGVGYMSVSGQGDIAEAAIAFVSSGSAGEPITLRSNPDNANRAIIDGGHIQNGAATYNACVFVGYQKYLNIVDLEIRNCMGRGIYNYDHGSVDVANEATIASDIVIADNVIHHVGGSDNDSGVGIWSGRRVSVVNNHIYDIYGWPATNREGWGILSYGLIDSLIRHNTIEADAGIFLKSHYVVDEGTREPTTEAEISYNLINATLTPLRISVQGSGDTEAGANYVHHNILATSQSTSGSQGIIVDMAGAQYATTAAQRFEHNLIIGANASDSAGIYATGTEDVRLNGNLIFGFTRMIEAAYVTFPNDPFIITQSDRNVFESSKELAILGRYSSVTETYSTLANWQAATSSSTMLSISNPDSNGVNATLAATITDAASDDYSLAAGSPALGLMLDGSNAGPYQLGTETIGVQN